MALPVPNALMLLRMRSDCTPLEREGYGEPEVVQDMRPLRPNHWRVWCTVRATHTRPFRVQIRMVFE